MIGLFSGVKALLDEHRQRAQDKRFLEASMGAAALLAYADGLVSLSELEARDHLLDHVTRLKLADRNEAERIFRAYVTALETDPNGVKRDVLARVTRFAGDPDLGPLLVRLCIVIAKADRDFSGPEHDVINELCAALGISPDAIDETPRITDD